MLGGVWLNLCGGRASNSCLGWASLDGKLSQPLHSQEVSELLLYYFPLPFLGLCILCWTSSLASIATHFVLMAALGSQYTFSNVCHKRNVHEGLFDTVVAIMLEIT